MTARLLPVGRRKPRYIRITRAELEKLRREAGNYAAAYHAGFADGQHRLADDLGVTLPSRIRTRDDRFSAWDAAFGEGITRLVYDTGRREGIAEVTGDRQAARRPQAALRVLPGIAPGGMT
jgi:hypothetical protein